MARLFTVFLYRLISVAFLLFIGIKVFAQDIESSEKFRLQNKSPEELVEIIKAQDTNGYSAEETILLNYPVQDINITSLYKNLAIHFYGEENFEKTIRYLDCAIKIYKKLGKKRLLSTAYLIKGNTHLVLEGNNEKALVSYYKGLEIAKSNSLIEEEIMIKSGRMLVFSKMGRLNDALKDVDYILSHIDQASFVNQYTHASILTTICDVYLEKGMYDAVLEFADQGIKLSKDLEYKEVYLDLYVKKGMVFYHKKKYNEALSYLFKSKQILETDKLRNEFHPTIRTNYFIAKCLYEQNKFDQAISYAQRGIETLRKEDLNKIPVIQTYRLLDLCYRAKADFKNAALYNDEYLKLSESYQKNKDNTNNKFHEIETEKLENEIRKRETFKIKDDQIRNGITIALVVVCLIVVFIFWLYLKKQKTNKILFNELIEKINQLESKETLKRTPIEISIDDQKVKDILIRIEKLEQQEYFLKSECNLGTIAKKVKTNTTYLSKIIHTHKGKNFNDYINDLRIEYALKNLKNNKKFRSFSIKSIAEEIGYKSDNSFTKHFKAKTGLNPSYYIRNLEKSEKLLNPENT